MKILEFLGLVRPRGKRPSDLMYLDLSLILTLAAFIAAAWGQSIEISVLLAACGLLLAVLALVLTGKPLSRRGIFLLFLPIPPLLTILGLMMRWNLWIVALIALIPLVIGLAVALRKRPHPHRSGPESF